MQRIEHIKPSDIEKTSFSIIKDELRNMNISVPLENEDVALRVIHTTADFDYASTLCFSDDAVKKGIDALQKGACIVTDTNMTLSGINKYALNKFGGKGFCFMADEDVSQKAAQLGVTRAAVSMQKAVELQGSLHQKMIFAIGNAPTALIELCSFIKNGFYPELVIGVPVGFVNVVASKELLMQTDVPFIVSKGRKGGSTVAAAICNALLYKAGGRKPI